MNSVVQSTVNNFVLHPVNSVVLPTVNNAVLHPVNNVVLHSMNNVVLHSMNNVVLPNVNNVVLHSMNNVVLHPVNNDVNNCCSCDNNVVTALFNHQYCYNLLTRLNDNDNTSEQACSINIVFSCSNNR